MARYAGQLVVPADGFGQSFLGPSSQKEPFIIVFFLWLFMPFFLFSSNPVSVTKKFRIQETLTLLKCEDNSLVSKLNKKMWVCVRTPPRF